MSSRIPTASEINVHDTLDERSAVKHFLGRDLAQAAAMFKENFLCYQEDLMFMGPVAFCFYVPAAITYLESAESDGESDAVNHFCSLIENRLDYDGGEIQSARECLHKAVQGIVDGFARFGCDVNVYGDLRARYIALLKRLDDSNRAPHTNSN